METLRQGIFYKNYSIVGGSMARIVILVIIGAIVLSVLPVALSCSLKDGQINYGYPSDVKYVVHYYDDFGCERIIGCNDFSVDSNTIIIKGYWTWEFSTNTLTRNYQYHSNEIRVKPFELQTVKQTSRLTTFDTYTHLYIGTQILFIHV